MFEIFSQAVSELAAKSGFLTIWQNPWQILMIVISFALMYLAIGKGFEPLLLLPIAFGMFLTNIPGANLYHPDIFINASQHIDWGMLSTDGGLLDYLYLGVKLGIYPPLIFLGVGAMTDFGPLIANPKSFLMGAAAQLGIFIAFCGALGFNYTPLSKLFGFTFSPSDAGSIAIIGGADGPTAIFTTTQLAPALLGSIAIAAYSYMALVPLIQPPIMKAFTTKKMRAVRMEQLRPVSKLEKVVFPILVTLVVSFLVPDTAPLIGMLMLGNLFKESGVADRLCKTAQNELMNIVTIFLGVTVGATATAENFLQPRTVLIIVMGLLAFCFGTLGGVLLGDLMYFLSGGKINPLIGSAGVSAVPMAARVSQKVGQKENPTNFLLMHAMGPNVAGVIGSAVAAGVLLSILPHA